LAADLSVGQSERLPMMMPTTGFAALMLGSWEIRAGSRKARDYRDEALLGKAKLAIFGDRTQAVRRRAVSKTERWSRAYLLLCAVLLVPIALSYGIAPAEVLPRFLDITIEGNDQTQIFRALMCLYFAASGFWAVAAFKPEWQRAAVVWAMLFSLSLAIGRIVSLLVDGPASRLLDVYLGLEIVGAALGVAVLAYTRNAAARR
jgi:hypothetical protein